HHRHGTVSWNAVKILAIGLGIGSVVGSFIGHKLSTQVLQLAFGIFSVLVGMYFYHGKYVVKKQLSLPSNAAMNGMGFGIGFLSNVLGIGGGTFTVPLFVDLKM